jgi:hypothetical protein
MLASIPSLVYILQTERMESTSHLPKGISNEDTFEGSQSQTTLEVIPPDDSVMKSTSTRVSIWSRLFGRGKSPRPSDGEGSAALSTPKPSFFLAPFNHKRAQRSSTSFFTSDPGGHVLRPDVEAYLNVDEQASQRRSGSPSHNSSPLVNEVWADDLNIPSPSSQKKHESVSTAATGLSGNTATSSSPLVPHLSFPPIYRPYLNFSSFSSARMDSQCLAEEREPDLSRSSSRRTPKAHEKPIPF